MDKIQEQVTKKEKKKGSALMYKNKLNVDRNMDIYTSCYAGINNSLFFHQLVESRLDRNWNLRMYQC